MAYIRIWIHCVWGTKRRFPYFTPENTFHLLNHIRENANIKEIYIDFINAYRDHVHCLISLNAGQTIDKTMQLIKGESSCWMNKNHLVEGKFEWADEYFAVSVSESQVNKVREYIKNQEQHHAVKTWEQEYNEFIAKFGFVSMQG
jgi:putative transposase